MIYLIITTSLYNKFGLNCKVGAQFEKLRKDRYIESIQAALTILETIPTIKPIIVENNGDRQTYLNDIVANQRTRLLTINESTRGEECDVVYTENNQYILPHKGVNELLDIKQVIDLYHIKNEDTIIKLTGRYKFQSRFFFDSVVQNEDKYDAFLKFFNVCTKEYVRDDCVLGLYAIKCRYLKQFDYLCRKSGESEFATFVRHAVDASFIMEMNRLDLECCFSDDLNILVV